MAIRKDSIVFNPGYIGAVKIKNRLIRSATYEHAATKEGEVSDALVKIHTDLARGGIGLIIVGIAWVDDRTPPPPYITRADKDNFLPGLKRLAKAVHDAQPDCRIVLQLYHPGRQILTPGVETTVPVWPAGVSDYSNRHSEILNQPAEPGPVPEPIAPSSVYDALFNRVPRALTLEEIDDMISAFADGIRRAREAGFDGAQLHAAHGWLLSSFLSPHTNKREDVYGGTLENRTRIVREIYQRARIKVGQDFPILIKFNSTDFLPDGIKTEDAIQIAGIFKDIGFDALEVSGGMWESMTRSREELGWAPVLLPESRTEIRTSDQEAYFLPAAKAIKENTGATVISVGGYRSFNVVERALLSGATDFVALSRPLVREPDLPKRWLSDEGAHRAACISCNACLPIGAEILACRVSKSIKSP
jgi:2,4-dienoyl-CoA reductase-like NADH-dependent reductase (Old Yellow Enzyme family)